MSKIETWLTGLLWGAAALLLPVAALEPAVPTRAQASTLSLGACADGSVHLAMGCASVSL
jgi:hypothetical protein